MVYLNKIVDFINNEIKNRLKAYPASLYYGVTTLITIRPANSVVRVYPAAIDMDGRADIVSTLKRQPFAVWHRISGNTMQEPASEQYGDKVSVTSSTDINLIVIGERSKINTESEQFAMIIADSIPTRIISDEYPAIGIKEVKVQLLGINYDPQSVFNSEFKGVANFLGPEMFMFSIRYRITGTYIKGCSNKCDC